ncbi:hypothetical protein CK203_005138 [Vitis vinifera]|uniref:Uncharacterized protein n=1 Tax=Vitis vinifera TaxID=29760 RepID=A0A438KEG7_VITVI|nr:hypothetical protein CK203_005138 [Vitis vinifera]
MPLRSGGNYSHVRSDLFTFSSRLFSGYLSFLLACHQEELFIKLTKTPFRGPLKYHWSQELLKGQFWQVGKKMLTGRSHLPRVRTPEASHGRSLFPRRGLRFVRWSIVSGGWEQLSAMTRVYEGIVTYLDDPIIIHRQFRKGLNFGLRWEALITRDSGDNHRHHSSMLGAWRDLSPYSNHSYDWQSDGRGLMGEGGVSCDVTALSETTNTNTKRSRRKKTFAELKEEEILLLKERTYLKKELATLRVTFKEQRATNESLKRMKIDFHLNLVKGTGAAATDEAKEAIPREEPHKMEGPSEDHAPSIVPVQALSNDLLQSESCQVKMNDAPRDNVFMLPDLNMMAMEDDIGSETLYGMI